MKNCEDQRRQKEFADWLRETIPTVPSDKHAIAELRDMPLSSLILTYLNWADRYVVPRKRSIYRHENFWDEPAIENQDVIIEIARQIEHGDDINIRLSDKKDKFGHLSAVYLTKQKKAKWHVKDTYLNGHSVHHMHLHRVARKQTRSLLFVRFRRDAATLVGVGDHTDFDSGKIAQRIAELNSEHLDIKGIRGLSREISPKDRAVLERVGIGVPYRVDDKIVVGAMLTSSGHSLWHVRYADRLNDVIAHYDKLLDNQERAQRLTEPLAGRVEPNDLRWRMNGCDLVLFHEKGNQCLSFPEAQWQR